MNRTIFASLMLALTLAGVSCVTQQPPTNSNSATTDTPAPTVATAPSTGVVTESNTVPVTLSVLGALFTDQSFKAELKSKLNLSDEQISSLQKLAADEIARVQPSESDPQEGAAVAARDRASEAIRNVVGAQQTEAVLALAREHWVKGGETEAAKPGEPVMLPGPNAIPNDTRIVVNIPAYRMDLFQDGSLIKSYKIGIGYPQFPLPTGFRKAQTIIFNPTWTPPDEPWVANMKDVAVGQTVPAGSPLNPLGPVKIPIGMPSLIHGGKPLSKIGTFASHGCVGLTNAQIKDFARALVAAAAEKDLSDQTIASYLKNPTKTRVVKLDEPVPVELRYETIVVEDGKLYIYKDVYDQNTNTEENLRLALAKSGVEFEDLSADDREQVLEALNAMSSRPQKVAPKPATTTANTNTTPEPSATLTENGNARTEDGKDAKPKAPRKPISRKQKQVVLEIAALAGKGYPAPVELDSGSGKPAKKLAAAVNTP